MASFLRGPPQSTMVVRTSKIHRIRGIFRIDAGIETIDHRSVEVTPTGEAGAPLEYVPVTDQSEPHTPPLGELHPTPKIAPASEASKVPPT